MSSTMNNRIKMNNMKIRKQQKEVNEKISKHMGKIKKTVFPNFFDHMRFHYHKIITYDPEYLFSYGFVNPKASVITWGMILRCLIMCGVGTFVSQFRCPAKTTEHTFCFPIMVPTEGLIFASLVAFLLGMFASSTFTRWWSCREKLTTIMNHSMMITVILESFCISREPQVLLLFERIKRWAHLGHALVHKQAEGNFDISDLVDNGLCTAAEADQISQATKASMPSLVWAWTMHETKNLLLLKKISPESEGALIGCINGSNTATGELMGLLRTQMPYSYLHLLTLITKIHLAFICFYAGGIIAEGITKFLWTRIMFGYVVIIANNVIYEGLLAIHSVLVNPCGDDVGDFPTSLFWKFAYDTGYTVLSLPVPESAVEPKEVEEIEEVEKIETHLDGTVTTEVV